jgi:hypothetical protein
LIQLFARAEENLNGRDMVVDGRIILNWIVNMA